MNLNKYGEVYENYSLENYNTYGIKTTCLYFIKPSSKENLLLLLDELKNNNLKYFIIGSGSNVILPDNKFNGVVISLELLNKISINNLEVTADAGVKLSNLVKYCVNESLSGLEYLALIPGSLGGALYGNAGVKNHTIYDNLVSVDVIRNSEFITLEKKDITISYRYTSFKENNDIILGATFKLVKGNKEEMDNIIKIDRIKRVNTQPLNYKNAGSVFKNPLDDSAGRIIESLNLKGYSINDAEISEKHANFIINKGNAKSKDIKDLIEYIQNKVYNEYKIKLELEQIIVKWD